MRDLDGIILKTKRILILTESGYGNIGQEAVLSGTINKIRSLNPDVEIICNSNDVKRSSEIHTWKNLRFVKNVSWHFVLAMISADCVIYAGDEISSEILDEYYPQAYNYFQGKFRIIAIFIANIIGKKTIFYCIGAYSLQKNFPKWMFRLSLERAGYISVRDVSSKRFIENNFRIKKETSRKIMLMHDPAYDLEPQKIGSRNRNDAKSRNSKTIGINLAYEFNERNKKNIFDFAEDIIEYGNYKRIYFFAFGNHSSIRKENDRYIIDEFVTSFMRDREKKSIALEFFDIGNIALMKMKMEQVDFFISMRFHPVILFDSLGKKGIIISSKKKTESLSHRFPVVDIEGLSTRKPFNKIRKLIK